MLTWAKFALGLVQFLNLLAALFRSKRDREAGANEAILEQKEATDALTEKAITAGREQRARDDADPVGMREQPDKYRRD